ncbi:dimethylarginine dimethylaminohydrolase family protein [Salisaeta longa]|uniref:dimethylarginine dimethylaminohydrolase family protein n=1 Tax=Salisaeta longa TaxID=503170 RepID=UPI0003B40CFD|nr:arginine deiminase family protein [Salisaeta longa]
MVYSSPDALDFQLADCPALPAPQRALLTTPAYFDVAYVINPHMEGHAGTVNKDVAWQQWKALRATYTALDFEPLVLDGVEGLPDMVFCANQTLPYRRPNGTRGVVLSRMHAPQRADEVAHYADFLGRHGYEVTPLPDAVDSDFEGMGDAIWHPNRYLLWGGYGFRTDRAAYEALAELLDVRVLALRLHDPDFYHLDTCFSVLSEDTVLIYPDAFDAASCDLIHALFANVLEAPGHEARELFACNAHCPDGTHVIIQEGCTGTNARLSAAGFVPVPVDTSEFLKSGGSVFCMKQMLF